MEAATTPVNEIARNAAEPARPRPAIGRGKDGGNGDDPFFGPTRPGDPEMSFNDFLDIINPLQHLPVVSTIYRAITGDTIKPTTRVMGDMLFGGPIGAAFGAASAMIEDVSGSDPGAQMMAALGIGPSTPATATASAPSGLIAEATTRPPETAAAPPAKPATLAAANMPQLSPASFDALIRSVGGQPAEAATASPAPASTAAAGSTEARRFFPARAVGAKPPRPVPLDIRPDDKASYEAALRMMQENMARYSGPSTAAAALPTPERHPLASGRRGAIVRRDGYRSLCRRPRDL
ncbi:hypothetical protein D3874_22690 [Oleomonas cavernae]|uniref:Uncharacterized protein n=1 Tax=Oleomonas cavernae TaxID=2320859 RepID=A0A418WHA9_9PROT|nr:hypothetical protein [Oleomonas cavernae]RJF89431.1 hypothetical protein D3874_22690 [Oleomonas cavernae]